MGYFVCVVIPKTELEMEKNVFVKLLLALL